MVVVSVGRATRLRRTVSWFLVGNPGGKPLPGPGWKQEEVADPHTVTPPLAVTLLLEVQLERWTVEGDSWQDRQLDSQGSELDTQQDLGQLDQQAGKTNVLLVNFHKTPILQCSDKICILF